jgi:hypothetical protein
MSDDYEPAITDSTTDAAEGAESEPVVRRDSPTAVAEASAKLGEGPAEDPGAGLEGGPRLPRQRSDRNRAMFRDLVAKVQAGEVEVEGDLEPMEHVPPPIAAAAAVAGASPASPAALPVAASVAPIPPAPAPAGPPPIDMGKVALEQQRLALEERERNFAAREAEYQERLKALPDRSALAEKPVETIMQLVRDAYGVTDDAEMKTALTDIITEMTERGLNVKLPDDVKTALESRKAVRSVKAYKADLAKQQAALVAERAAAEKSAAAERETAEATARERQAVSQVERLLADPVVRAAHRFLLDPEVVGDGVNPAAAVISVIKEQLKAGRQADWQAAARYADDYYKSQAEALWKKSAHLQSLLAPATPAPAVAPATAATSTGGAPGPAPTTPKTPAPKEVEWDPSDLPMDRQQRRLASLAKLVAAKKAAAARP